MLLVVMSGKLWTPKQGCHSRDWIGSCILMSLEWDYDFTNNTFRFFLTIKSSNIYESDPFTSNNLFRWIGIFIVRIPCNCKRVVFTSFVHWALNIWLLSWGPTILCSSVTFGIHNCVTHRLVISWSRTQSIIRHTQNIEYTNEMAVT